MPPIPMVMGAQICRLSSFWREDLKQVVGIT
jgi:hypothetical protein